MKDPQGRYLLFAGDDHYPAGGWGDFIDRFDSLEDARLEASRKESFGEWSHIIDLQDNSWIADVAELVG